VFASKGRLSLASSAAMNDNGQPIKQYTKDLIRVGEYYKAGTDQAFEITSDRLLAFAASFASMKQAGVKIPVPEGHTNEPSRNRGYVDDMYVEGDTLYAKLTMVGEDAISLAGRAEVSIYAVPEFIDGKGNKYKNVIEHVAIVTNPVIPDQGGFVPIAASHGATNAPYYSLSNGDTNMMEIAKALGIDTEGMDEAAVKAAIMAKIEGMSKATEASADETKKMAEEVKASRAELATLKLSREKKPTDPMVLKLAAKNRTHELDSLVKNGNITPAVRDRLAAAWIGKDNTSLALSLDEASDTRFEAMVNALGDNDPKVLGARTRTLELSRETPGGDNMSNDEIEKMAKERADRINGVR